MRWDRTESRSSKCFPLEKHCCMLRRAAGNQSINGKLDSLLLRDRRQLAHFFGRFGRQRREVTKQANNETGVIRNICHSLAIDDALCCGKWKQSVQWIRYALYAQVISCCSVNISLFSSVFSLSRPGIEIQNAYQMHSLRSEVTEIERTRPFPSSSVNPCIHSFRQRKLISGMDWHLQ